MRAITDASGNVTERNDYYAFGKRMTTGGTYPVMTSNRWKYNGKEVQTTGNVNWLDYGAREYDEVTGRWTRPDPMSEKYYGTSGYTYCVDNPINKIDLDGLDWYETVDGTIKWTKLRSQKELDKNKIRGNYLGEAYLVFNGSRKEKLGSKKEGDKGYDKKHSDGYIDGEGAITANVTLYGPNGEDDISTLTGYTMTSNAEKFIPIEEGLYDANYDEKGKSGTLKSHWVLNHRGVIPTMDGLPNTSPYAGENYGKGIKTGIFIHSTNRSGYAGGNISTGCLLLSPKDFQKFNSKMTGVQNFKVLIKRD
ncbi:MAG: RHS repeat-associated core domain-containing protein [Bacteroidales bacterium]|nr:RHS repeat-associated core domain-containing protein [Bacteroidales bacterium]MCI1732777.1 RHS repeat-associated core domain-containing protein [Bacteroidales bacterium]